MQTAPRVTVLMSVYNGSSYLAPAIESILAQTFRDFTFVIYEDASTDESARILSSYADSRMDLRVNRENRGLTRNLIDGVQRARSDYIARMDADDIAHPERLAAQVIYLDRYRDIDVLGTNVMFFNEDTEELGRQPEHHDEIALELFFGFTMMHPTIMLRRDALVRAGLNYDPAFIYSQDFDLWTRMLPGHRFANLQTPLLRLREHSNKISRSKRDAQQSFTEIIRRRMLSRICPDIGEVELEVFGRATRGDLIDTENGLKTLEALLLRLIGANHRKLMYAPPAFEQRAAGFFRETCRQALVARRPAGAIFWRSELRRVQPLTARQSTAMAVFTLRALVNSAGGIHSI